MRQHGYKYELVANSLRETIINGFTDGAIDNGVILPTMDDFAQFFGIGRGAVMEGLAILKREKLISVEGPIQSRRFVAHMSENPQGASHERQ